MAKITKQADVVKKLRALVEAEATSEQTKAAELAQTNVSGEPCKDTKVTSVSESTEHTDKNNVGPDKLNNEQGYEQKPTSDKSEPVASPKSAEVKTATAADVDKFEKMATDILSKIEAKIKESDEKQAALAQTGITGKPGADTKIVAVSDKTEHTDKNDVGPEHLNSEQGYEQDKAKDKSTPVEHGKKAEDEDAVKIASYNLGATVCESILKRAAEIKGEQEKQAEVELLKEAGRRDMDLLIAQATAELEAQQKQAEAQDKYDEYQGALAFDALYKQAQLESLAEENTQLKTKLANYEELEKKANAAKAIADEEERFAKLAALVTETIKRDLAATPAPAGK
jgi:hypothetical protein